MDTGHAVFTHPSAPSDASILQVVRCISHERHFSRPPSHHPGCPEPLSPYPVQTGHVGEKHSRFSKFGHPRPVDPGCPGSLSPFPVQDPGSAPTFYGSNLLKPTSAGAGCRLLSPSQVQSQDPPTYSKNSVCPSSNPGTQSPARQIRSAIGSASP